MLTTLNKRPYLPSSMPLESIFSLKTTTYMVERIKRVKMAILEF